MPGKKSKKQHKYHAEKILKNIKKTTKKSNKESDKCFGPSIQLTKQYYHGKIDNKRFHNDKNYRQSLQMHVPSHKWPSICDLSKK